MLTEIDARNLSCPQPVVITKKALDELIEGSITTIVNDEAALQNLLALAKSMGCETTVEQKGEDYHIHFKKQVQCLDCRELSTRNDLLVFTSSKLGQGDDELGTVLIKSLIYTLVESEDIPRSMLFLNSAVELTCEDSPVLEHLMSLEKRGVEVLSCGTCLDFFQLKEKLCVGQITNMYTVWDKMSKAEKVINF